MGFLDPYTGPSRKMTSNLRTNTDALSNMPSQNDDYNFGLDNVECIEEEPHTVEQHEEVLPSGESTQFNPKKKQRKTVAEIVAQPMADYLKVVTQQRKTDDKSMENPMLTFFKSVLPDTDLLNAKRKRQFKIAVMDQLNRILDEQEYDSLNPPSLSGSSYSGGSSNSQPHYATQQPNNRGKEYQCGPSPQFQNDFPTKSPTGL